MARGLRERGVGKGDMVAVSLGNCWEFAVVTYALFKLGGILVSLEISSKRDYGGVSGCMRGDIGG